MHSRLGLQRVDRIGVLCADVLRKTGEGHPGLSLRAAPVAMVWCFGPGVALPGLGGVNRFRISERGETARKYAIAGYRAGAVEGKEGGENRRAETAFSKGRFTGAGRPDCPGSFGFSNMTLTITPRNLAYKEIKVRLVIVCEMGMAMNDYRSTWHEAKHFHVTSGEIS